MGLSKHIDFLREDFTRWLVDNPSRDVRITAFERGEGGVIHLREQLSVDAYQAASWEGPFYVFDPSSGDSFSAETKHEVSLLIPELRERLFQQMRGGAIQQLSTDLVVEVSPLLNPSMGESEEVSTQHALASLSGGVYVWNPKSGSFAPDTSCKADISRSV